MCLLSTLPEEHHSWRDLPGDVAYLCLSLLFIVCLEKLDIFNETILKDAENCSD